MDIGNVAADGAFVCCCALSGLVQLFDAFGGIVNVTYELLRVLYVWHLDIDIETVSSAV